MIPEKKDNNKYKRPMSLCEVENNHLCKNADVPILFIYMFFTFRKERKVHANYWTPFYADQPRALEKRALFFLRRAVGCVRAVRVIRAQAHTSTLVLIA